MSTADALAGSVKALARELGFARVGIARAEALSRDAERLRVWLAAGRHGSMGFMAENVEVRVDPTSPGMVQGAASVIVVAAPLDRGAGPSLRPGRVARYAWGRDYHNVLTKRLRRIVRALEAAGHVARPAVDTKPLLERAWAQRAGVGFVGKNACLIVPGLGSHVMLGCVVTTADLPADEPMQERCGRCTACLDACPTEAFVGPRDLDARRCIAYLTIEHEGPIDPALRASIGDWAFGCDACQDVCPWNHGVPRVTPDAAFAPDSRWEEASAESFLQMDDAAFDRWSLGSPVRRTGARGMARNAALVLGNAGNRRHLPVLREAAEAHPDETVREAAAWAAGRIEVREAEGAEDAASDEAERWADAASDEADGSDEALSPRPDPRR